MKWFNSAKTQCLDLDKIAFWEYLSKADAKAYNEKAKDVMQKTPGAFAMLRIEEDTLKVHIGGSDALTFTGEEAVIVYNLLTSIQ